MSMLNVIYELQPHLTSAIKCYNLPAHVQKVIHSPDFTFFEQMQLLFVSTSAGLQDGLIRLRQDLVADLGVGDRPVLLAQVKTQLALVAEVEVALLALRDKEEIGRVRRQGHDGKRTDLLWLAWWAGLTE